MTAHEHPDAFCPHYHHAVELIGRRWSGAIIRALLHDVTRFSDILVWDTRGTVANAMVTGPLPLLRYVVLTDRLIEEIPDRHTDDEVAPALARAMAG